MVVVDMDVVVDVVVNVSGKADVLYRIPYSEKVKSKTPAVVTVEAVCKECSETISLGFWGPAEKSALYCNCTRVVISGWILVRSRPVRLLVAQRSTGLVEGLEVLNPYSNFDLYHVPLLEVTVSV